MKKRLRKPTKAEEARINAGIAADADAFEASAEEFAKARRGRPPLAAAERKQRVTLYLDRNVVDHFKAGGRGWQTRANAVLVRHVKRSRKTGAVSQDASSSE